MSDPRRFLTALSQTLASMALYGDVHPATERARSGHSNSSSIFSRFLRSSSSPSWARKPSSASR